MLRSADSARGAPPLTSGDAILGSVPASFGPFRVLHQVGAGSLGPVFRAHDPVEGRLVAIKAFALDLPPDRAVAFVEALQALALRGLDHPAIASPVAAGLEGAVPWLAQAYVPAESLDAAIDEYGPPPLGEVLTMVTHLAGALDFAAAAGVLHGALHPTDVLVAPDETCVTDLGVAGALHACGLTPPTRGRYSAPEVLGGGPPTRAADVFALAAIAFELIAGEPVQGMGDEAAARLPEIPGAHRDALVEAFAFGLAAPTDERFPTALGFAGALKRALGSAPAERVARPRALPVMPARDEEGAAPGVPLHEQPQPDASWAEAGGLSAFEPRDRTADAQLPSGPDLVPDMPSPSLAEGPVASRFSDLPDEPPAPPAFAYEAEEPPDPVSGPPELDLRRDEPHGTDWNVTPEPSAGAGLHRAADAQVGVDAYRGIPRRQDGSLARRSRSRRTAMIAALLVGGLAGGLAGGYLWGRSAADPMSSARDASSGGAGVAPGEAVADDAEVMGGDANGATEIELPPEVVPEPLEAGTPPEAPPAPADEPEEPVSAAPAPARTRPAPPPAPARAPAATGRIAIRSTPPGARVDVNGSARGETPLTLGSLPLGAYDIRVTQQGYAPEQRRVTLTPGRPSHTLSVPMRRAAGTGTSGRGPARAATHAAVLVDSRPRGATVFLDGRRVGTTPLQLPSVSVGRHVFRLELEGYRPVTTTEQIVAGERNRVAASLEEEMR